MEMFLTNLSSNERLRIPLLPDRLNVKTGAMVVALTIIKTGEVKIPRGNAVTGYSFNGVFPSDAIRDSCYVFDWQEPTRIVSLLRGWQEKGDTIRFMVTDLSVNADVFIEKLNYEFYGIGDISYTLTLTVRRELLVTVVPAPVIPPTSAEAAFGTVSLSNATGNIDVRQQPSTSAKILGTIANRTRLQLLGRQGNWYIIPYATGTDGKAYVYASHIVIGTVTTTTATGGGSTGGSSGIGSNGGSGGGSSGSTKKTGGSGSSKTGSTSSSTGGDYQIKSGDSLYSIAKATLGDGSRWQEIYDLNKSAIDAANSGKSCSKYTVYAGASLNLPTKNTTTTTKKPSSSSSSSSSSKSTTGSKSTTTKKPTSKVVSVAKSAVKKPSPTAYNKNKMTAMLK